MKNNELKKKKDGEKTKGIKGHSSKDNFTAVKK